MKLNLPPIRKFFFNSIRTLIGLTAAGFVMSWFIWRECCKEVSIYFWISFLTICIWISLWLGNAFVSNWMDNIYSWHKEPLKRLIAGLIGMTVYTISAVLAIIYFFHFVFGFNIGDELESTFVSTITITLIITMFMTGREFLVNWKQTAVDAERLKRENDKAQYESLKSQVNPHFLFNSLNALSNLVYQDQDKAVKFIKQLSDVYRYVLDSRDKEVVSISDELQFLESYLYLQQIRYGDKLRIDNNVEHAVGHIAPLALQMLVENAIKHNVISEDDPLTIRIYKVDTTLVVENSLKRKHILPEESPGLGLENIKKRYEFLSEKKVEVIETDTTFQVSLPILVKL